MSRLRVRNGDLRSSSCAGKQHDLRMSKPIQGARSARKEREGLHLELVAGAAGNWNLDLDLETGVASTKRSMVQHPMLSKVASERYDAAAKERQETELQDSGKPVDDEPRIRNMRT